MNSPAAAWLSPSRGLGVFVVLAWVYLIGYAFRAINALIAPELTAELGLTQAQLGLLSAAYFITYSLMQLPLGVLLDRYGARRVQTGLVLVLAAGALIFAWASNFALLWLGRALIGLGGAGSLMAAYKVFGERYSPHRMPQLSAWMLVAGAIGALLVTVPAAALLPAIGWRGLFIVLGVLGITASLLMFLYAPAAVPHEGDAAGMGLMAQAKGFRAVFASPHFWRVAPLSFVFSGCFMALQSLWAGPWLTEVGGLDTDGVGRALLWFNVALLCGHLAFSFLIVRLETRGVSMTTCQIAGALYTLLAFGWIASGAATPWPWLPWVVLAVSMCTNNLSFTVITRAFPGALTGRVSTALNLMIFLGAFTLQWGIGALIDLAGDFGLRRADGIRLALGAIWLLQCAALAWMVVATRKLARSR